VKKLVLALLAFLTFAAYTAYADELSIKAPIIIPNVIQLAWSSNTDVVDGYIVHLLYNNIHTTMVSQTDTIFIKDLSALSSLTDPTRIRMWVTAYNSVGESAPSDTVSFIYANNRLLFGDWDRNGKIDGIDMTMFWHCYWRTSPDPLYKSIFDADQNKKTDAIDYMYIGNNYGEKLIEE